MVPLPLNTILKARTGTQTIGCLSVSASLAASTEPHCRGGRWQMLRVLTLSCESSSAYLEREKENRISGREVDDEINIAIGTGVGPSEQIA